MWRLMIPLSLILITGCSTEYIQPRCPTIKTLRLVKSVDIHTTKQGGLDHNNTVKVFKLVKKLRGVEVYYHNETTRLNEFLRKKVEEKR